MKIPAKYFGIIYFMFFIGQSNAQFVAMKDSAFATFICKNYPSTTDVSCKSLDTTKAAALISKRLNIEKLGIRDLSDVNYLKGINFIKADSNNFQTVQLNFNNFPLVFGLNLSKNNLKKVPNISPLKKLLKELYLNGNNIEEITGLDSTLVLTNLNLDGNHLEKIPFITNSPNLAVIRLENNYFTFEDLLTVADYPNFKNIFYVFPQKTLTTNTIQSVFMSDTVVLKTAIDSNITNITYNWYKNNTLVKSSTDRFLKIVNFQEKDAGTYYVELKHSHPQLASGSLKTGTWTLNASPCQAILDLHHNLNVSCKSSVLSIENLELSNKNWGFDFFIENTYTKQRTKIYVGRDNEISQMGDFNLVVSNQQKCEVKLDNWLSIHPNNCDLIFTPDGDGNTDTYLIEGNGKVKILNKRGQEVNKFQIPIYWDGKDKQGKPLPVGLYGIQFEDGRIDKVTIIR